MASMNQNPARVVGAPCRDGCFNKVTLEGVDAIFKAFWEIGDCGLQEVYLQKMVVLMPVKKKTTKKIVSRRSCTFVYTVQYNNQTYRVCKGGFLAMHGITEHRVQCAVKKLYTDH